MTHGFESSTGLVTGAGRGLGAAIAREAKVAVGRALHALQAMTPHVRSAGGGSVVTIGTHLVQNPVVPYHDHTAAKSALKAFTRTASKDLGPLGGRSTWWRAGSCAPPTPAPRRPRPWST